MLLCGGLFACLFSPPLSSDRFSDTRYRETHLHRFARLNTAELVVTVVLRETDPATKSDQNSQLPHNGETDEQVLACSRFNSPRTARGWRHGNPGRTLAGPRPAPRKAPTLNSPAQQKGTHTMNAISSKDGTQIYYKDWGKGPVVTFSHGWPLNADAWDGQMHFLVQQGFRVVAHDRRGHGRSGQASSGNDMNGYADDLAAVIETLDLRNVALVGHSTGGGEVVRYIGRHGTKRVAKAVLIAVSDIAAECGLADQPHFTRLFRRFVGESPAAWRRARASPSR